jgi:hypothetical protein
MDLTKQNLLDQCSPNDGQVHIAIGVVYRQRMLKSTNPFVLKTGPKGMERANKVAARHQEKGYDCVQMLSGSDERGQEVGDETTHAEEEEEDEGQDEEIGKVLYWTPGIALLLGFATVIVQETCSICLDRYKREEGYMCCNKHFMCWDCFGGYISSAAAPDAIKRSVDSDGNLKCMNPDCDELCSLAKVAACGAPAMDVFKQLHELQTKVAIDKNVADAVEKERNRMNAEFQRIQAIEDAAERKAHLIRLDVIDRILTLRCPRCRQAFLDFVGCFALTCSSNTCHCGFCAWCLKDCGDDAHAHVYNCPEGQAGEVFGTWDAFEAHHRERKRRQIEGELDKAAREEKKVATLAYRLLLADLIGTGIALKAR